MAITYTTKLKRFETLNNVTDDLSPSNTRDNVITKIHWELHGDDGNTQLIHRYVFDTNLEDLSNFTSVDEITKEQLESWVFAPELQTYLDEKKQFLSSSITEHNELIQNESNTINLNY